MIAHLFHAGPLYRLERRAHVIRDDQDDLIRHAAIFLAVGWVPLIILSLIERAVTGEPATFLRHLDLHTRWLLALPALFLGERRMDDRIRHSVTHLVELGIIPAHEKPRLDRSVRQVARWRDSLLLELFLLLAGVSMSLPVLAEPRAPVEVWQLSVSLPLMRYLIMRFLLRWFLWSFLLLRITTLDLRLMGTHPDRAGGLGVLAEPSRDMGLVAFGVAGMGASGWATQIIWGGATPSDFLPTGGAFVLLVLALAFGPLLAFGPVILRTKNRFVHEYAAFADRYAELFHEKWIAGRAPDPLGTADLQSFADLANVFAVVQGTRLLIFSKETVLYVLLLALLPLLPIYFMSVPMNEVLSRVIDMVL